MSDLVTRSWNDTPISRRPADGYVNATAMCKANGKRWNNYFETDRASSYIETLASVTGIPVTGSPGLVQTRQGGSDQGTWVHPQVAVDLARWISAPFAVWMDAWFLDETTGRSTRKPGAEQSMLKPQEALDVIERSYGMLERFGVVDDRDRIQFGDMVRNVAARGAGGLLLPPATEDEELTISDAWLEVVGTPMPRGRGPAMGRLVAEMFREEFQQEPPSRTQYVDGAPRKVKSYRRGWLTKAIEILKTRMTGEATS